MLFAFFLNKYAHIGQWQHNRLNSQKVLGSRGRNSKVARLTTEEKTANNEKKIEVDSPKCILLSPNFVPKKIIKLHHNPHTALKFNAQINQIHSLLEARRHQLAMRRYCHAGDKEMLI